MLNTTHGELVARAAMWLRRRGFGAVATEIAATGARERPDAIGFRELCSAIIEAKASRADFLADREKPERTDARPGLGVYRFYLAPQGIIAPQELIPGWGLLEVKGRALRETVVPPGNLWPAYGQGPDAWRCFQHETEPGAERAVLYSLARRRSGG